MTSSGFAPTSRYALTRVTTYTPPGGEAIVHLRRRFLPPPERFYTIREHTVVQGERPDQLGAKLLGDPEQTWRLADSNNVLRPEELTETPGKVVRVTLPEGVSGPPSA